MDMSKLSKLQKQMRNVPFGTSVFQIKKFNRGQETPERLYRNCLLQLNQKLMALKECQFRRQRYEIDLEEIEDKLKTAEGFEKRRLKVDKEEKTYKLEQEIKLIEDCCIECGAYAKILEQLPEFTRAQFEDAEGTYWQRKLLNDLRREVLSIGHIGKDTLESLEQIGIAVGRNEQGRIAYTNVKLLEEETK